MVQARASVHKYGTISDPFALGRSSVVYGGGEQDQQGPGAHDGIGNSDCRNGISMRNGLGVHVQRRHTPPPVANGFLVPTAEGTLWYLEGLGLGHRTGKRRPKATTTIAIRPSKRP